MNSRDSLSLVWVALLAMVAPSLAVVSVVDGVLAAERVLPPRVMDGASSPREQPVRVVVTDAIAVQLAPPAYATPTSGYCVVPDATEVFKVAQGAVDVSAGDGPFCTDAVACPAGPSIPVAGRAWARVDAGDGPVTLACSFVDGGGGFTAAPRASGGGAPPTVDACLLVGDADCQMTGQVRLGPYFSSVPALSESTGAAGLGVSTTALEFIFAGYPYFSFGRNSGFFTTDTVAVFSWSGPNVTNNGRVQINGPGSAAAPSLTIASTQTGLFASGSFLASSVGGVEKLRLGLTQNVSAVPVAVPSDAPGALTFSGADPGAGLYHDSGLNLVGLQGSASSGANVAISTAAGFGGDILVSADGELDVSGEGDSSFVAGGRLTLQSTADDVRVIAPTGSLQVPRYVSSGPTTLPACNAGSPSGIIWRNDTADALPGQPCVCVVAADNVTFSWVNLAGAACAP